MRSSRTTRNLSLLAAIVLVALSACDNGPTDLKLVPPGETNLRRLAYHHQGRLHVIDVDGSHDTTVTPNETSVSQYSWHSETRRIAYYTADRKVHILDRLTGTDHVVTTLAHPTSPTFDVATMHPDGSGRTIVSHVGAATRVSWVR
jgi:hypothetical protein